MNKIIKSKGLSPFSAISKEIRFLKRFRLKNSLSESLAQEIDEIINGFANQKRKLVEERSSEKLRHVIEQAHVYQRELASEDLRKNFISQGPLLNLNKTIFKG